MARRTFALLTFALLTISLSVSAFAHEPHSQCKPITQPIDLIGPIGNDCRESYRRTCNRPRYLPGKIAYLIAPSSQEAMTWHRAEHLGAYEKDLGRIERHYFYPKPWEALRIGPRVSLASKKIPTPEPLETAKPTELPLTPYQEPSDAIDAMEFDDDDPEVTRPDLVPSKESMESEAMESILEVPVLPETNRAEIEAAIEPETLPLLPPSGETILDSATPRSPEPLQRMKDAIQESLNGPVGSGLK